jgi:hypothetical protein
MSPVGDVLKRWPAFDIETKRARLKETLRITQGPLRDALSANAAAAERAAAGLWRRDPSVWTADADVQKSIANRLGWLCSPLSSAPPCLCGDLFRRRD